MKAEDLKNSILQLAIQGKLVEQREEEGTAKKLFEQIKEEKEKLIKEGKIKKQKKLTEITEEEIPFDIPESWEWVKFRDVCAVLTCGYASTPKYVTAEVGMPFISAKNVKPYRFMPEEHNYISVELYNKLTKTCNPQKGDILLTRVGAGIGEAAIIDRDFPFAIYVSLTLIKLVDYELIDNRYILYWLNSPIGVMTSLKNIFGKGASQGNLNVENVRNFLLPLPPLEEQKRIVARIEEFMPYVNQYDKAYTEVEELNKKFPEDMQKSILQYAIQGKLVEQREEEGNAEELYQQIQEEKKKLVKEGKIKKTKALPEISEDEIPFDIPESWKWVRLEDICEYIQRGKSPKYSDVKKYPVVAQKCNQWSGFSLEKAKFIDPNTISSYKEERFLVDGDLMWNSTGLGTLGRVAIYEEDKNPYELAVADSHVTVIRPLKQYINYKYLYYYIANPSVQNIIEKQSSGSTKQKELATNTVKNYIVPLPPQDEQKRIVEKIEELLPYAKQLVK